MSNSQLKLRYVTLNEAATYLAVSRDTARRMIRRGELVAVKIGRGIRIEIDSLEAVGKPLNLPRAR